jgi:hypothetical protein
MQDRSISRRASRANGQFSAENCSDGLKSSQLRTLPLAKWLISVNPYLLDRLGEVAEFTLNVENSDTERI